MATGIYRITCMPTGLYYVGSAQSIERRWWAHRNQLAKGTHHALKLQAAWNTYGESAFVFEVLEETALGKLVQIEDTYLLPAVTDPLCANTAPSALMSPSLDPAIAKRIGETLKVRFKDPTQHPRFGATLSPESRAKISANRKGKQAGKAHYRYGKTLSEEVRKKIGDAQRGVAKGPRSAETRRKLSEALKERFKDPAAHPWTGKHHTKEARAKMSKQVRVTYPEGRQEVFPSLTAVLEEFGLKMPTLRRALQWGSPISKGPRAGFKFEYLPIASPG